jgi:hypothetical protein
MAVARKVGGSGKEERTMEANPTPLHSPSKRKGHGTQLTLTMILMVVGAATVFGNILFVRSRQQDSSPSDSITLPHGHLRILDASAGAAKPFNDFPKLPPGVMAWAEDSQGQPMMHGESRPSIHSGKLIEPVTENVQQTHLQHPFKHVQHVGNLDWSLKSAESCEGYFGNGYSSLYELVDQHGNIGSFNVRALDSVTSVGAGLPMAWCRVHPSTEAVLCAVSNVRMNPDKITIAAGGEHIDQVIGRNEDSELPGFAPGSFDIITGDLRLDSGAADAGMGQALEQRVLQTGLSGMIDRRDTFKYLMLNSMSVVDTQGTAASRPCDVIVQDPVIFLTRVEYANLFHTSTGERHTGDVSLSLHVYAYIYWCRLVQRLANRTHSWADTNQRLSQSRSPGVDVTYG